MSLIAPHSTSMAYRQNEAMVDQPAGIPFRRLVQAEGRKLVDTRAPRWLLGLSMAASLAMAVALPFLARAAQHASSSLGWTACVDLVGALASTLVPITALLLVTSEWSQRGALTTFLVEPRRERVLAAKAVVALVLSLATALCVTLLTTGALFVAAHGLGVVVDWPTAGGLVRTAASLTLNTAFAVAMGLAVMAPAGAIVAMLFLPQLFTLLAVIPVAFMAGLVDWLSLPLADVRVAAGDLSGHGAAKTALAILVWVVVPSVVGVRRQLTAEPR